MAHRDRPGRPVVRVGSEGAPHRRLRRLGNGRRNQARNQQVTLLRILLLLRFRQNLHCLLPLFRVSLYPKFDRRERSFRSLPGIAALLERSAVSPELAAFLPWISFETASCSSRSAECSIGRTGWR